MSFYEKHLFFCVNQRSNNKKCCHDANAMAMRDYAKKCVKRLGLKNIRVNQAGCLGRCKEGPIIVIYPEGVWYTYHNEQDIETIVTEHLMKGKIVERLLLPQNE